MPIDESRVDRMIRMMDDWFKQREQDKLNGYDDEDEHIDPEQYLEPPHKGPIAEPSVTHINTDSSTKRKDLFR
jgi:hypothetical protein